MPSNLSCTRDQKRRYRAVPFILLLALAVVPAFADSGERSAGGWEQIDNDDGIRVWRREVPGSDLPAFRGEVMIAATPKDIAYAIGDVKSHPKWMFRCIEAAELKYVSEYERIVYNRTDAPWPIWDRDVIVEARAEPSADGKSVTLRVKDSKQKLRPVPENVVRMPKLDGLYQLTGIGEAKTKVVYQVEADPGGSLPRWIAERGTRDLPYRTLASLRERMKLQAKK